jgi:hypothetical protein
MLKVCLPKGGQRNELEKNIEVAALSNNEELPKE